MLLVGLGNPEDKYRLTRHNAGFLVLDAFAKKHDFPDFTLEEKSHSLISEDFLEHQKIILAKPQAFMNNSGKAVAVLYQRYQARDLVLGASGRTEMEGRHLFDQGGLLIDPGKFLQKTKSAFKSFTIRSKTAESRYMVVIHDDIDLPLGRMKISVGSGPGGHKGVESIIQALGSQDFPRMRIGIQPEDGKPAHVEEFVLQQFSRAEHSVLEQTIENACSALEFILLNGIEKAMNEWN